MSEWLNQLFEAKLLIAGFPILWREIIGNLFGFASAIGGMKRQVWAWPIGIVGNVLLFTVFMGVWFTNPQQETLWGQASRQVFFVLTSLYGWWRWRQSQQTLGTDQPAILPRWASNKERLQLLAAWVLGVIIFQALFRLIGTEWPAPDWYFWCDAWIFVGSIIATFAMAKGWTDFWLAWLAVDAVGIPLLIHSQFYPSALLYSIYGALVIYGFVVWLKTHSTQPTQLKPQST